MEPIVIDIACAAVVLYLCVVRSLRWRRYNAIHAEYRTRFESKNLTPEEAQKILHLSAYYDMPLLLGTSLSFALFKTYAVPSISKILAATRELKSKDRISRRYADTEILICTPAATWVACPISGYLDLPDKRSPDAQPDPRAMIALARVNWLHSKYPISNDDFVYTLCLFALEPPTWAARYGWRSLSNIECYAYFVFWFEIGQRMGIRDIPDSVENMRAWSLKYEKECMVPAQTNKDVAGYTTDELLHVIPETFGLKNFFRNISICLLEEPVRIAMLQPMQSWYMHAITRGTFHTISFVQRSLCLPRRSPKSVVNMESPKFENGSLARQHPVWWQSKPWYKPQSSGLGYLKDKLAVLSGFYTEMPGPHLKSGGYRLEELGPIHVERSGQEQVLRMAGELLGCPAFRGH
ncbi:hypothetical protein BDZ94DRAFT_1318601 [Collybia nuda]|uniref:ER-bound oxygenase mpaB/mpaB'/Rubber oxygenase catalytic domain-containing protein n=1 Tax=Collybia nuda TaxID=64659 RepID=A0A9P6CMT6_9AGAR|nr:hypothetical protein BDZ94DRAFT_1318601 [Collybia nuda]